MKNKKEMTADLREFRKAAIYCRNAETYGSFELKDKHNTIAYQTGSAMTFITDNKLDFCGLYMDETDKHVILNSVEQGMQSRED